MNGAVRKILVIAVVVMGAGLVLIVAGNVFARGIGPFASMNMMGWNGNNAATAGCPGAVSGGTGMMGNSGMMYNGSNMMTSEMMGFGSNALQGVKPLTVDQTTRAVNEYLAGRGYMDLGIAEVMVFDNNAYARVSEKSTGTGAFELLVDPVTLAVYPEPGPNMMWNSKYSHMNGMMGAMMGGSAREVTTAMPVSAGEALKAAQTYLNQNLPGAKTAEDAEAFYGYYTIDILRDGKVAGMLSVNGYTSQVFIHTWHGNFVEMSEGK